MSKRSIIDERDFPNNAAGHKLLIAWLRKRKATVRVTLAGTGIYSLDLSTALHTTDLPPLYGDDSEISSNLP
jgi:hypothetical protein